MRVQVGELRKAGARDIHLRVASPPIRHACYFGVDFPDKSQLIATGRTVDEIRDYLGVDSLHYLPIDAMLGCVKMAKANYCTACFSGDYPVKAPANFDKFSMEQPALRVLS